MKESLRAAAVSQLEAPTFASHIWTSDSWDGEEYNRVAGTIYANQALTLEVQQSANDTNFDYVDSFSIAASTGEAFTVELYARYVRFKVTVPGGTDPTTFRFAAWGKVGR